MAQKLSAMWRKHKGITLIELLLVILLIGIFSGIAYPNVNSWVKDRKVKKEVYDVINLINERKSDVTNGKYGMVNLLLKPNQETYTMTLDNFFNTYKNISANNIYKTNNICGAGYSQPNFVRDKNKEIKFIIICV